ncbi:4-azaleucine resistance transporter AzlC [Haloactinospora alba]|uniref:4-azaleucine resistance transporter AzlC n=1 Tax=Haloactinospora alba TaxID=405555 RepID=A0A543N796_9ACTN|nr:AzlC family ABC transporter permease [Haloactinospora alba]TQN27698.1 4-azaleucine resistance transporter AzlC [Haloactinospora alba]
MRTLWRTLDRGLLRTTALVCLAVGVVGVSYGATAVTSGFPVWFPVLVGVLVLAGSSEFLFVGILAAGGSPVSAVAAGVLVNARHLPFGLALADVLGRGWRRLLGSHLMNDESVVLALGQEDPRRQRTAYWVCGLGILLCWPAGALAGALAGTAVTDPDTFGLDAMFPTVLLALVLPSLRSPETRRCALLGAGIALAASVFLPAGLPVLLSLVGLVATVRRTKEEQ